MRLLFQLILSVLFLGCGLFTTREPENPVQSRDTWIPATTVDLLLENLKSALSEKSTDNYLRCLVDSTLTGKKFTFIPATESFAVYSNVFMNWNLLSEKIYLENLKSKLRDGSIITLSFFNDSRGTIQSDSLTYTSDYLLIVDHTVEGFPREFEGHLQFTLLRNLKGEWSILTWKDSRRTQNLTWSDLKGRFSY